MVPWPLQYREAPVTHRLQRRVIAVAFIAAWAPVTAAGQLAQDTIVARAAGQFVGRTKTVCDVVAGARAALAGDTDTRLDLGEPQADGLTVAINQDDRKKFGPFLEAHLPGFTVCVEGKIERGTSGLAMRVKAPSQFKWLAQPKAAAPVGRGAPVRHLLPVSPDFAPGVPVAGRGVPGITWPTPITHPNPDYTEAARRAKVTGSVEVQILVGADGKVSDARMLLPVDPIFGLDEAALKTAREWTFKPAMRDGAPIPVVMMVEMSFNLR